MKREKWLNISHHVRDMVGAVVWYSTVCVCMAASKPGSLMFVQDLTADRRNKMNSTVGVLG